MAWYSADLKECDYLPDAITILVVGASGDLAKKKTYPALFDLYRHGFLTKRTIVCGYARSHITDEAFRDQIRPYLTKHKNDGKTVAVVDDRTTAVNAQCERFLTRHCLYRRGAYDSVTDMERVFAELEQREAQLNCGKVHRLFYFAIPPSVFVPIGRSIRRAVVDKPEPGDDAVVARGWTRLIIEKPFGHDSESFARLSRDMGALYTEDYLYRIDHYLGKEMVQNLVILRFANAMFEPIWNRNYIKSVQITFKENFGCQGRGGYFDKAGIIRDVLQNHLMQVLSLVAMEPPNAVTGQHSAQFVRDEKVKVLRCIDPVQLEDVVLGQYLAGPDEVAYTEDPTVPDDSVTPTFCTAVLWIKNPRWQGVPFILKAGKALNERKAEIRIQFHSAPGARGMFPGVADIAEQELVMRLQPDEAVYLKTNVKSPGLMTVPVASELDLSYKTRFDQDENWEAYTRLILEVIRGRQATFVRDDELQVSWDIFTPLLHRIEDEKIQPSPYAYGSRGPAASDALLERVGYRYHGGTYQWKENDSSHHAETKK